MQVVTTCSLPSPTSACADLSGCIAAPTVHLSEEACEDVDASLRSIYAQYKELPFVKVRIPHSPHRHHRPHHRHHH